MLLVLEFKKTISRSGEMILLTPGTADGIYLRMNEITEQSSKVQYTGGILFLCNNVLFLYEMINNRCE